MTEEDQQKAFRIELVAVLKKRTAIMVATRDEIVRLLKAAQERIVIILASQPSDYQLWSLSRLKAEIVRILTEFGESGAATVSKAADAAWLAGQDLVEKPLAAGGIRIAAVLPRLDVRQLEAMRTFMTDRMRNVAADAAGRINSELGLVLVGAQSPGDAIGRVNDILGGHSYLRARTIVRTELSRAFAVAANESLLQSAKHVPGMKKRWRRSGKVHSRTRHDMTDGQVQPVDKPFVIGLRKTEPDGDYSKSVKMMHPHDPSAPASETINCGCVCLPYMEHWKLSEPLVKPFSAEELVLNPKKRMIDEGMKGPTVNELIAKGH